MSVIWPGQPFPLGASYDGAGTNFAVFSAAAERIELCLFDDGVERRIELTEQSAFVHHGYLPGIGPGQHYGFRVHGKWSPGDGQRANPHKLLLDPYAKAIEGDVTWGQSLYAHHLDDPSLADETDSADATPRSVVVNPFFDWGHDRPPRTPLHESILYETHVRGLTMTHPDVPPALRGTYAGLGSEPIIRYLTDLGVTAVELLPVHHMIPEGFLIERGLTNYWGYNSVGFFAPEARYASNAKRGRQVQEFRQMVKDLHHAGIEVILDVVYNHTAEGSELGPTFCFRGLDNAAYYRLDPQDRSKYVDYTGCGNSLNMLHPHVLQLIMDSLRYWISEMHVDGFRFDLAAALARELHDVDRLSAFFDIIQQDPIINRVKLIAEPWDLGEGGYQVGNFPPLWSEWNGKYRDEVRDYWRGADETLGDLAFRFTGSSDLYGSSGRRPSASINFVTAHDGFTLADLVSYERKHNDANLEDNRDGTDDNRSWNSGAEGPTADAKVLDRRGRRARGMLATLLLSQGVPMLLGGDEIGRTQSGNNNAYCQDNSISWHDWQSVDRDRLAFTRRLTALRRRHPVFHRREFFEGSVVRGNGKHDIAWLTPSGATMTAEDWQVGYAHSLMVFLNGEVIPSPGPRGEQVFDGSFLVLVNANDDAMAFTVPADLADNWELELDSARPTDIPIAATPALDITRAITVEGFSVVVLRSPRAPAVRHC
jgi:isoamylase